MKITVFGASGRTGIPLVQQALDAGHHVTAFVRTPSRLPIQHERLTIVQGDVIDAAAVDRAIAGSDAVITALSPAKGAPIDLLPKAADHILAAMRAHNVRRLIWMTGAGVRVPQDQPKLIDHVFMFILSTFSRKTLEASRQAIEKVRQSDRDWTVVRAPRLLNGDYTGSVRVGYVGANTSTQLIRADAAYFLLGQAQDETYLRQLPMISN